MNEREPILFCFCGPTASGKTTIAHEVIKRVDFIEFSISTTTRDPRKSEVDGKDYYFVSPEEFDKRISGNKFLEHAEFSANKYGTEIRNIFDAQARGFDLLLDIEVQGIKQLKQMIDKNVVTVFVIPPSKLELVNRLRSRGTDSEDAIKLRLQTAIGEIETLMGPNFSDYLIVNDNLEESIEQAVSIITAERCKYEKAAYQIEDSWK